MIKNETNPELRYRDNFMMFLKNVYVMSSLLYETSGDIGILTYNKPQMANAMNRQMVEDLIHFRAEWKPGIADGHTEHAKANITIHSF